MRGFSVLTSFGKSINFLYIKDNLFPIQSYLCNKVGETGKETPVFLFTRRLTNDAKRLK